MTVAEFIEKLKQYDQNRQIIFVANDEVLENSDKFVLVESALHLMWNGTVTDSDYPNEHNLLQSVAAYKLIADNIDNELWKMRYVFDGN